MGWASAASWLRHAHGVLGCNIIKMVDVVFCLVQAGDAIRISEGTIEVYDFNTNSKQQFSRRKENQVHGMPVSGFCCSLDSSMLVVLEADNTMRFWNIK